MGGNMPIDDTQALLGRLYTNSIFRKEFITDKKEFYQKYKLLPETISFMEAISIPQLTFFAEGLLKKRIHEVRALLPLSAKLIGKSFNEFFFEFCDHYTPCGIHKHQEDAIHFVNYCLKQLEKKQNGQLIASALLYEQEQLNRFINTKAFAFSFYKYDFIKNYKMLLQQEERLSLPKKLTIVIWKQGKFFFRLY